MTVHAIATAARPQQARVAPAAARLSLPTLAAVLAVLAAIDGAGGFWHQGVDQETQIRRLRADLTLQVSIARRDLGSRDQALDVATGIVRGLSRLYARDARHGLVSSGMVDPRPLVSPDAYEADAA